MAVPSGMTVSGEQRVNLSLHLVQSVDNVISCSDIIESKLDLSGPN
jgi:hypothetical protein